MPSLDVTTYKRLSVTDSQINSHMCPDPSPSLRMSTSLQYLMVPLNSDTFNIYDSASLQRQFTIKPFALQASLVKDWREATILEPQSEVVFCVGVITCDPAVNQRDFSVYRSFSTSQSLVAVDSTLRIA